MYPEELVLPMKKELTDAQFNQLLTENEVESAVKKDGSVLFVINSVCGCAAGSARPGVLKSLNHSKIPNHRFTVFAGFDSESTAKLRSFLFPFPPSSPAVALFKDGELKHMLERHHIEGHTADEICDNLINSYNEFC